MADHHNKVNCGSIDAVVQAGTVTGGLHIHSSLSGRPVPRQLPAAPRLFAGREDELVRLDHMLSYQPQRSAPTMVISAIGGAGGIGKTWLALHWAHQNLDRFPDGQLHVNLHGFNPRGRVVSTAAAARGFLDALGVRPAEIPLDPDAQTALYRSLVSGRRMLIFLDNAASTAQVEPLLPGSPTCTVLVTSRNQLPGLITGHGARHLQVDVLSENEARALLAAKLGIERIADEFAAVETLLKFCNGFPLALSVVAGRAYTHPYLPLASLVNEIRELQLDALTNEDCTASFPEVMSWSYRSLTSIQANMFTLLGIAPGPDISLPAAAAFAGISYAKTRVLLRTLEQLSLVSQNASGRYRMHDLVRLYAASETLPQHDRIAALRRLNDFYLHTAHSADQLLDPHRPAIQLSSPAPGCHPLNLKDPAEAITWLEAEHACLLAAQQAAILHGWHRATWQFAWVLDTFHYRKVHPSDRIATWQVGSKAASRQENISTRAITQRCLGDAYAVRGQITEAVFHIKESLSLANSINDVDNQAHAHLALTWTFEMDGSWQNGFEHATRALKLFRSLNSSVWQARTLAELGLCIRELGEINESYNYCKAALALHHDFQDSNGEAYTLGILGDIAHEVGHNEQAAEYFRDSLALHRKLENTFLIAPTLYGLGRTLLTLGHIDDARKSWQEALVEFKAQNRTRMIEHVTRKLESLSRIDRVDAEPSTSDAAHRMEEVSTISSGNFVQNEGNNRPPVRPTRLTNFERAEI